jgi:hypothetical protein
MGIDSNEHTLRMHDASQQTGRCPEHDADFDQRTFPLSVTSQARTFCIRKLRGCLGQSQGMGQPNERRRSKHLCFPKFAIQLWTMSRIRKIIKLRQLFQGRQLKDFQESRGRGEHRLAGGVIALSDQSQTQQPLKRGTRIEMRS